MSFNNSGADDANSVGMIITGNKGKRAVKERDKNAPRRNQTAYLLFQQSIREQYKALYPEMNLAQIAKKSAQDFAAMSPEDRELWERRAEADRVRYLQELARYTPPAGFDATGNALSEGKNPYSGSFRGPVRKRETDPNRPRRHVSAFLHFQNHVRDKIREENPTISFGQMSKRAAQLWEGITPEEKQKWEQQAAEDKSRYEREIADYTPPFGFDKKGRNVQVKKAKRKKRRDPDAPKRSVSAYVFFGHSERPKIQEENPDIEFKDVGRKLGERWRNLAADERAKFEVLAQKDRDRYAKEMAAYNEEKERKAQEALSKQAALDAEATAAAATASAAAMTTGSVANGAAMHAATGTANFMQQYPFHPYPYPVQGHFHPDLAGLPPMFPGTTAAAAVGPFHNTASAAPQGDNIQASPKNDEANS